MSDVARKITVVVVATALYWVLLQYVVGYSFAIMPGPRVLEPLLGSYQGAALIWVQLVHTFAVLLAAFPVAILFRLAALRPLWVSFVPGLLCAVYDPLASVFDPSLQVYLSMTARAIMVVDALKIALAVPPVLWVLNMLPSNTSLERTREG